MKKNVFFLSLALMIGLSTWTAKAAEYGSGDLSTFIATAEAGSDNVITLTGTAYSFTTVPTLTKTLTIQADPALSSRPVITCSFATAAVLFTASGSADQTLTLKGLEFAGNALANGLTQSGAGLYKFTVSVDNCKASGFATTAGTKLFGYSTTTGSWTVNGDLTVLNSTFVGANPKQILGIATTVRVPNNISFTNCFFDGLNTANTTIAVAPTVNPASILIDHCTFRACSSGAKQVLALPLSGVISLIKNSIFVNIAGTANNTTAANTSNDKNVVYNSGVTNTAKWWKLSKEGVATNTLLTTNPNLDANGVTQETTYLTAGGGGTDGKTIGYTVPVAAVAPSAPTALVFTPGVTSLSVSFTAGANGGAAISDYKYSINGGAFVSAGVTTSPINITGLTTATSYNIEIKAVNSAGDGTASATATGRTSQTVVYVSTTGNDTNDGLTVGTPVATFARAIAISCPATTNIYLAVGNYVQTTTASLNALSNINLTISGESASNTTISTTTSAVRLLVANNTPFSASNNTVTIRNLTFSGANITASNVYGGAIQFNQGLTNAFQSSLILENMIFDNNKVTASAGTAGSGGALSTNFKNVTITGCYFKNNQALSSTSGTTTGGAIFVGPINNATGDTSGSFVNISNTTFDGNVATSKGGAVLVNNNVGPATLPVVTPYAKFTNCTFVNNKVLSQPTDANTNIKNGSAICFNSGTTATMYKFDYTVANCTFAKNQGGTDTGTGSVWESKSAVQFDGTNWTSATLVNNIFAPSLTANCGTTLSVSDAESTKFTAEYNAIESVDALATDATFGVDAATNHNTIAALDPSNLNAALTDNTAGAVFAVPYLGLPGGSLAINAGTNSFGSPNIVPSTDVRGQANVSTKELGAYEFPSPLTVDVSSDKNLSLYSPSSVTDVTVLADKVLTVDQTLSVKSMTINPGGKLNFSSSNTLTFSGDLILKATDATSFSANIGDGTLEVGGAIKYLKTIDDSKWFFISFPSDVTIAGITGNPTLGTLGTDWFIKYYNGAKRGLTGEGSNWVSIAAGDLATYPKMNKYQGYIIGLKNGTSPTEITFTLDKSILSTETTRSITVAANNAGEIATTNHGWNLIGQPYLSKYVGSNATGAFNIYISDGTSTYTPHTKADVPLMNPMSAYFIQANTTLAGTGISFNTAGRQSVPSSVDIDTSDEVRLNFTSSTGTDYTLLTMDNSLSNDYEIGYDLEKWIGTGTSKPQVYSMLGGINYAFNALPMTSVQNLPLGVYNLNVGAATISANAAQASSLSKLILTDNLLQTTTDLLISDYQYTATVGTDNNRFSITAQRVPTNDLILGSEGEPTIAYANGKLMFNNLNEKATIRVYDAIGRMVVNKFSNNNLLEIPLSVRGLYTIQIEMGVKSWKKKVII